MTRTLLQQALGALHPQANRAFVEATKDALRSALAAPQPEPEKRIVWCTETDSACSTCPTLRIPCQAATQAAALNARVTVPREPTQEMIAAGEAVFRSYCFRHVNGAIPTYEAMIAAVPAPAAPPPIDNRFVAPGCEQFGTRADAESLLTMLRATLDEYMRLAAAPAVHPDEFTCPYCFDQGAAPAVPDDIAAIIACLGDDAALLRETTDDSEEIAQNMDDAAAALERLSAAPAVPDLKHKPTVQRLMDLARKFRATPGDLYDGAYKELQQACYEALSAAPAVREPQDERIRWRDAVIKEAESALRTAEQEFADMPTWANVGHAAKKVTHALAVIAAHGIGGGGK